MILVGHVGGTNARFEAKDRCAGRLAPRGTALITAQRAALLGYGAAGASLRATSG